MKTAAKLDAQQIENMEMKITFCMKVSEWRDMMRKETWMLREFSSHIAAVLGHITRSTEMTFDCPPKSDAAD